MSQIEKLLKKFASIPSDLRYDEYAKIAKYFNYEEYAKAEGSRVRFYRKSDGRIILLHKPHNTERMKKDAVRSVLEQMKKNGDDI